nr:bacteriohopanetetrol glucosamine biosynthesis glycosyltransferase HpnI [uncultured Rhodopila sp.]
MTVLASLAAAVSVIGLLQVLVASQLVARFAHARRAEASWRPPVTVLKPLHGDEPLLEDALATICRQGYPQWQVVFGVQEPSDPAVAVVRRLQSRFPACDIVLVIDPALHGRNRKVGNLINMLPAARHDVLVIADSDVHVQPDYLDRLVCALAEPGVGLVTTIYAGLPATKALPAMNGAVQITQGFLPGAIMARAIGRQDCLGATMCLRRRDLVRCGGFRGLVDHLADDNVLGRKIMGLGLRVGLADTVPLTTVPEDNYPALFRHELRWARTIRALEPAGFAASAMQYPLAWALLTILLSGGELWAFGLLAAAWLLRAVAAIRVDRALATRWKGEDSAALAFRCPVWLLPARDLLSVAVMVASYGGRQVDWRGYGLHADTPDAVGSAVRFHPIEEINAR